MKPLRILLVYPEVPDTFWTLSHARQCLGELAYSPPLGLMTVAALLPESFERRLRDLNVTTLDPADLEWADYVFLSAMHIQRQSSLRLIERCRQLNVKVVAGGPLFTSEPDAFQEVDHLLLGEAELTMPEFLRDLELGTPKGRYVADGFSEMKTSPRPAYGMADLSKYLSFSLQYSRGCPNQCDFCDVTTLFGHRPRTKTAPQIIAELNQLYALGWRGLIFFVDDNLMCDRVSLKRELLPALIAWKRDHPGVSFHTQISMNLADDPELVDMMYEAGFDRVFIGIETPDEASLQECHKRQNLGRNVQAQVLRIQRAGLQVTAGFIVGFDHDGPGVFELQYDFIQASGIAIALVNMLNAPPGTELHRKLGGEGRLVELRAGDGIRETNIVPRMGREPLLRGYQDLVNRLYEPRAYYARVKEFFRRYKGPREQMPLNWTLVLVAVRCLFWLGLVRSGRVPFWRVLVWTVLHKRSCLQTFLLLAIFGYHFRKTHEAAGDQAAEVLGSHRGETPAPVAARL